MMIATKHTPYLVTPEKYGTASPEFRRRFRLSAPVRSATLAITAWGVYEAHLNGERVGDFVLAPGWTSYHNRLQVQEYDVTAMLKQGINTLTVLLGEGWCCGRIAYDNRGTVWPRHPMATLCLKVVDAEGITHTIRPDRRFEVRRSGISFSCIYEGETFDATSDAPYEPATVVHRHSPNLIPQQGEILKERMTLPVKEILTTPKGETVLDFGQNLTGYLRFTVRAEKGSELEFDCFEVLDREGNAYTEALRSAWQTIRYTCRGGGGECGETYQPHFTYQGFRYVRLKKWAGEIRGEDFEAVVVTSDLRRTGSFTCSSPLVNRLCENIVWGQMGNFLDVPTDCPQRDERLGWTGDAQVFCRAAAYHFDVERFFDKWLSDLSADQFEDGSIPAVVPHVIGGKAWSGSAAWGDAATVCPWEIYLAYGNRTLLARQYPTMKRWVDYIRSAGTRETVWDTGRHYGDHLALDNPENYDVPATDKFLVATAMFAYSTSLLIKAGRVLGEDVRYYEALLPRICADFRDTFTQDQRPVTPTQTAYALGICFGLVPEEWGWGEALADLIRANGDRLTTGFVGTAYLMQALTATGHADVAYKLLLQEKFPSWLFSVRMGATTIWEHWDGIREDGSMWSASMNSFNHYAYGAVGAWMFGTVAGIRPDENAPGYRHFFLAPTIGEGLDYVRASYAARQGLIRSEWRKTGDGVRYTFEVPMGTTATVILGDEVIEVEAGVHEFVR